MVKKIEKDVVMTRFGYTLKKLHSKCSLAMLVLLCVQVVQMTMNLVEEKK
jgi:hypothetical protein